MGHQVEYAAGWFTTLKRSALPGSLAIFNEVTSNPCPKRSHFAYLIHNVSEPIFYYIPSLPCVLSCVALEILPVHGQQQSGKFPDHLNVRSFITLLYQDN